MARTPFSVLTFLITTAIASFATAETKAPDLLQAQVLFRRLTGVSLLNTDSRLQKMSALIHEGQVRKAAAIATDDPNFLQVTVKNLAAKISSKDQTPFISLDDFQATFIGTVADELDARLLLSGNYLYRGKDVSVAPSLRDNQHYEEIDFKHLEYKSTLTKQEQQWPVDEISSHAGVMTTRAWGWNYDMGTNRRAVLNAFERFLCTPIAAWKVPNLPEKTVARDIDRSPGKKPQVFQNQCLYCHGGLDPMRDAFSRFDFLNNALFELPEGKVAPKYKRGAEKYPYGHKTRNDSWINPIALSKPELGFKETQGKGIQAFGEMIAHADAFRSCMAERVFSSVCQKEAGEKEAELLKTLAIDFMNEGYNLKKLFQATASSPECLEEVGIKTFKSIYQSLSVALNVKPTSQIDQYYQNTMTRLPKDGRIDELSSTMLLAEKALAALFCKEFSIKNASLSQVKTNEMLLELSNKIYGRDLSKTESKRILSAIETIDTKNDPVFLACTIMASSIEFLLQFGIKI